MNTRYSLRSNSTCKPFIFFILALSLAVLPLRANYEAWSQCMSDALSVYNNAVASAQAVKDAAILTVQDLYDLCLTAANLTKQAAESACDDAYDGAIGVAGGAWFERNRDADNYCAAAKLAIDNDPTLSPEDKAQFKADQDALCADKKAASEAMKDAECESALDTKTSCYCTAELEWEQNRQWCFDNILRPQMLAVDAAYDTAVAAAWDAYTNVDVPACGPNPGT